MSDLAIALANQANTHAQVCAVLAARIQELERQLQTSSDPE